MSDRAVFLDRDGTLVEEVGYITVPDGVRLLPGAVEAVLELRRQGWKIYVVSNQAAVAKGMITEEELEEINQRMIAMLAGEGALLDGIYCCPHHPEGSVPEYAIECGCRKPKPGLLERAASENGLDLAQSVVIGDNVRDLEAGRTAGTAAGILVLTGHGPEFAKQDHGADYVARDLPDAAAWLARRG